MRGIFQLLIMFFVTGVALLREKLSTRDRIRNLQRKKLRRLLRHAKENVPFYAELYKDVNPDTCKLEDLLPVTKKDLMKRLPDTLSVRGITKEEIVWFSQDAGSIGKFFRGKYVLCSTSGTTGMVGHFMSTQTTWSILRGVEFARLLRGRLAPKYLFKYTVLNRLKWAMLVATGGHYITYLLMKLSPGIVNKLAKIRPFSIMDPMHKMVAELNEFQPHYLHGYPTFLEALAYEQLAGRLKINPDFISSGSEPFSQMARSVLQKAYPGVQMSETYGTTEALSLANQCARGRLHVNDDYVILEGVDDNYRPVPFGMRSRRTLVTNLVNKFQPIIRYELNDSVVLFTGQPCPCGSPLRVVEVHGRSDDTFFLMDQDGHFHAFPPIPFEVLFLQVKGLKQYQLIHEEQNHLRVRYARVDKHPAADIERQILESFNGYLDQCGLAKTVKVSVEEMGEITRPPSTQKVRQIFSKVKAPPNAV
jgi:putative adenylate-forming enzyme